MSFRRVQLAPFDRTNWNTDRTGYRNRERFTGLPKRLVVANDDPFGPFERFPEQRDIAGPVGALGSVRSPLPSSLIATHRRLEEASPVATIYLLTEKGETLKPVFDELDTWARAWYDPEIEGDD